MEPNFTKLSRRRHKSGGVRLDNVVIARFRYGSDVKNNSSKYGDAYTDFIDMAEVIVRLMSLNADLTNNILNVVAGFADVMNWFHYDVCDALVSEIDSSLQGQVTYDDVRPVIDLIQKVNDQTVILDDLFIDVNSQLGYGFDDDVSYNGFLRYVKIFTAEDYTDNRAMPDEPGIVHNLEIMNSVYINRITSDLICGVPTSTIIEMNERFTDNRVIDGEGEVFSFIPENGGTRTFVANGCKIKLYYYDENDCLTNIGDGSTLESENTMTFSFSEGTEYLFFVTNDSSNYVNVKFSITNKGTNEEPFAFFIDGGQDELFTVMVDETGFYMVEFYGFTGSVDGLSGDAEDGYYAYFQAGMEYDVYLKNEATSSSTVIVSVEEPNILELNEQMTVTGDNRLVKYVNDYSVSMAYKLELNGINGNFSATVYDSTQNLIANVTVANTKKTYTFILSANQTCYIAYSGDYASLTSKLYCNETQLRWKVDGQLYESTKVQLPQGYSCGVELISLVNNQVVNTAFVFTDSDNFSFINGVLTIATDALIGYDIVIYPTIASEYLLTIQVGFNNDFTWYISNGNDVSIVCTSASSLTFNYSIANANGETNLSSSSKNTVITSYLPKSKGVTTVKLNYIIVNKLTFTNGTRFLDVSDISVDNLFAGGNGDSLSPYQITCQRHLNNIRYNTTYDRDEDYTYIKGYYKLVNDITLSGTWTPIEYSFKGTFDGNLKIIKYLEINITATKGHYGLFGSIYSATIKDLTIKGVIINSTGYNTSTSYLNIGALAGNSDNGIVNNCHVYGYGYYKTISVVSYKNTYVGGLIGSNGSRIQNCTVNNIDMTVSSNAGGIAGGNSLNTITDCSVTKVCITYVWNTENACLGGVVGLNGPGATVTNCSNNCASSTFIAFEWDSPDGLGSNVNKTIYPSIGFVIGENRGTYSGLSSNLDKDDNTDIDYHWQLMFPTYDQSKRMFKVDGGNVGYDAS